MLHRFGNSDWRGAINLSNSEQFFKEALGKFIKHQLDPRVSFQSHPQSQQRKLPSLASLYFCTQKSRYFLYAVFFVSFCKSHVWLGPACTVCNAKLSLPFSTHTETPTNLLTRKPWQAPPATQNKSSEMDFWSDLHKL